MAKKAAVISIDINAGTARMLVDLERAKGGLRDFGTAGSGEMKKFGGAAVNETKAATAAIKALEGGFADNKKAATAFLTKIVGAGPILQAAFPVFGAMALYGVLEKITTGALEFFRSIGQAPAKISSAFRELNEPLRVANDQLAVTNDRLANDIAKIEGRRQNTMALALDEARLMADKLAESLQKDLDALLKLEKEQSLGGLKAFIGGAASTGGDEDALKKFAQKLERMSADTADKVRGVQTGPGMTAEAARKAIKDIQDAGNRAVLDTLDAEIGQYKKLLKAAQDLQALHEGRGNAPTYLAYEEDLRKPTAQRQYNGYNTSATTKDQSALIAERQGALDNLGILRDKYALTVGNSDLTGRKNTAEQAHAELEEILANARAQSEVSRREAEDWQRLITQRTQSKMQFLQGIEKINAEELEAIQQETERTRTNRGSDFTGPVEVDPEKLAYIRETFDQKRIDQSTESLKKWNEEFRKMLEASQKESLERGKFNYDLGRPAEAADERIAALKLESQQQALERHARIASRLVEISGGSPDEAINEQYRIRIKLAGDLKAIEDERIRNEKDAEKKRVLEAERDAADKRARDEAADDRELRRAELRRQRISGVTDPFASAISGSIADAATGGKANIGQALQGALRSVIQQSIERELKTVFAKLMGEKKGPSGRPGDPVHVWQENAGSTGDQPGADFGTADPTSGKGGVMGVLQKLGGVISGLLGGLAGGSGGGGGDVKGTAFSTISYDLPGRAFGGPVDPGRSYLVGERGEAEIFTPWSAGTVTPLSKSGRNGGDVNITNHIDARNADLGAANRLQRMLEATHQASVSQAVQANAERERRRPQVQRRKG